jgi:alkylation response protein AidB-like acyl-CoA dehydrogenase
MLESIELYLQQAIAPRANVIDFQVEDLKVALQELGDRNLLALRVPKSWGGADLDFLTFSAFQELVARYSGALAFLQTQHQSAGAMIAKSQNETLKRAYLPLMGNGQKGVGIGFSHLRRETNPPLKAIALENGYQLHGSIPWLTGWNLFQDVLIAGLLPDGQAVYGIIPFSDRETLKFSEPMPLAAMSSTNTVSAELIEWFLPNEWVVSIQPAKAIDQSDRMNILNHSFFALGCAQAGLDVVEAVRKQKAFLAIAEAQARLQEELAECRMAIYGASESPFEQKLKWRAIAIDLAVRCAHAAVIVSSGAANSLMHPAQRIYREALVFSVAGQTSAVLEASLEQIARQNNFGSYLQRTI